MSATRSGVRPPATPLRSDHEGSPARRILAHFELRFFETFGFSHEFNGSGVYPELRSLPQCNACTNQGDLDSIVLLARGDVDEAAARIDVLFGNADIRRLGAALYQVRVFWRNLESAETFASHLDSLVSTRASRGVA